MAISEGHRKLAIHGPVVELDCAVPFLDPSLDLLLSEFKVPGWQQTLVPTAGAIHPFEEGEVISRLPESARHLARTCDEMDIYEEGGCYWVVDDRWGMMMIDPETRQWQSWIVPQPTLDAYRVAELSVLWPIAQLLRSQGVHLLPAISAVREGFAFLLICPFGVEPEMTAMINSGYKLIGQRWTALREEDGRMALLHMPGRVERLTTPRLRYGIAEQESWIDVTQEYPGSRQRHAFCDAVLVAEPGRGAKADLHKTEQGEAVSLLRDAWPMTELYSGQHGSPHERLARSCRCFEVQLSRNSKDLLSLLNYVRCANPHEDGKSAAA
jgi:hypothetical protein